jgi:CHAT domain-containing protein
MVARRYYPKTACEAVELLTRVPALAKVYSTVPRRPRINSTFNIALVRASRSGRGPLTASEVTQLKLNADWVVLPETSQERRHYPGLRAHSSTPVARALLVSHWSVESNAATRLTTPTFDVMRSDPTLGRAGALRRAMLAYMNDTKDPLNDYPALWAPFVVVGDGVGR